MSGRPHTDASRPEIQRRWRGRPRVVFNFTLTGGRITAIDLVGDPGTLEQLDLATLPG